MPRAEQPIEAEDSELGSFAAGLRKLRDKAGKPSYRALASRAHYSPATLSDAAGGKKLPSLAVTLAYVKACDGDPEEWEERWRSIAAPPDPTGEAPYVGLKAFQKEDAGRFFGREKLTAKLSDLVARRPFVGVFGASGSGKSSLLRAGLLPRLPSALIFTPGVLPLDECAVRLAQLTGESAVTLRTELADPAALGLLIRQHDEDLVLVVDQFEEVFTLCGPEQRDWFGQALVGAPHVVIGVRADFYGHIGRHPELVEALEGGQLLVGPMTTDELRRAITEPARHVGATVETALVARLVADVAGQSAALPLVQHALAETWHRRRGMTLSLVGYEEAGGVEHAIARTAEAVYADLSDDQQQIARRIFLRFIALGEGTEDTKRRAIREDLDADVLERLAAARLVTLTERHAELTHEALIRSWPRLRDWIAEDRNALRVHHQLTEAAASWDGHDRDVLYKGIRLAQVSELNPDSLTEPERVFVTASQSDGRRRARRTRVVVSLLSVLVVLLAGTVVFAVRKADEASKRSDAAVAAAAATESRRLALQNPAQALRVAHAAYRVAPSDENRDAVLSTDAAVRPKSLWKQGPDARYSKINGGSLYVGMEESTFTGRLWDVRGNASAPLMTVPGQPIFMSDDDDRLVVATDKALELLDISDPAHPRKLADLPAHEKFTTSVSGMLDTIAGIESNDGGRTSEAKIWSIDNSGTLSEAVLPSQVSATALRLSPDGKTVAVLRTDVSTVEMWRLGEGEPRRVGQISPGDVYVPPIEFSPDGRYLLLSHQARATVQVWDVSAPANPVRWADLPVPSRKTPMTKFAPDGRHVLIGADATAQVWDLQSRGAARIASFENFPDGISGADHWPSTGEFVVLTRSLTVWRLRTNIEQVVREHCGAGGAELSDEEWAKYFPNIDRVPVC